jgi:hypothetical protein
MDRIPEPTNDHERSIAEAIDSKLAPNGLYESIVVEVAVSVPFDMSIADTQFLLNYAHWRLAHPVKKQPTRGVVPDDLKRSG